MSEAIGEIPYRYLDPETERLAKAVRLSRSPSHPVQFLRHQRPVDFLTDTVLHGVVGIRDQTLVRLEILGFGGSSIEKAGM